MLNHVDDEPKVSYLEDKVPAEAGAEPSPPEASEPTVASDRDVSLQPQMSHAAAVAATRTRSSSCSFAALKCQA